MVELKEEDEVEETEDESTFHTCNSSLQKVDVGVCRGEEAWLTDITGLRISDLPAKISNSVYDKALQVASQQNKSRSFRLELSESEASKADVEKTPTNPSRKVAATPKTGGVKASAFFSIGKRNDDNGGKTTNLLAGGSDASDNTDDDDDIVISPKQLNFGDKTPNLAKSKNVYRSRIEKQAEKTVVFASDSEEEVVIEPQPSTPQPNFLSHSRLATINDWVTKSPFHANHTANISISDSPAYANINDLLLTSDEDEPVESSNGKMGSPIVRAVKGQNDLASKTGGSPIGSKENSMSISQIALQQLMSIGKKSNKSKLVSDAQDKSNSSTKKSSVRSNNIESSLHQSLMTSKAGGSWEESQPNTERTSKAGGSWEESQTNTERTSKGGGSGEESQANTERSSKAGGSWEECQVNTERTSKASPEKESSSWEDEESQLRTVEFEKSPAKTILEPIASSPTKPIVSIPTNSFKTPKIKTTKAGDKVTKGSKTKPTKGKVDESNAKKVTNTSVTWGPLENSRHGSVNAVRCWDEKRGESSPTKEKDFGSDILKPSGELSKKEER